MCNYNVNISRCDEAFMIANFDDLRIFKKDASKILSVALKTEFFIHTKYFVFFTRFLYNEKVIKSSS